MQGRVGATGINRGPEHAGLKVTEPGEAPRVQDSRWTDIKYSKDSKAN